MSYSFGQQQETFAASTGQIVASGVIAVLIIVAAIASSSLGEQDGNPQHSSDSAYP